MFKEGINKIKELFGKNPTVPAETNAALEKSLTQTEQETSKITSETFENASKNPGSK
jgi:hypothetical protein